MIEFRDHITVELVEFMADDESVARAARVSTGNDLAATEGLSGLINFLMANRHGTPFEHNALKFRIEAPIFVWREFMRHRIGFSYNEMSGRYTTLPPEFYVPAVDRPLVQVGKAGAYSFIPGEPEQVNLVAEHIIESSTNSYAHYLEMLEQGIAKEVARMVLPVNIFSTAYVTCNARSLMSFLSLRTKSELAKFPSYPQREIEMVAEDMESAWSDIMPVTWASYNKNGRVAP